MLFYDLNKQEVTSEDTFTNEDGIHFLTNIANSEEVESKELLKSLGFAIFKEEDKPEFNSEKSELVSKYFYNQDENTMLLSYEIVHKNLEEIKQEYIKKIDLLRDKYLNENVIYKDSEFQNTEKDRALLTSAITLYSLKKSLPPDFGWIDVDNKIIYLNLEELIELGSLMARSVEENIFRARVFKDNVLSANTYEAIIEIYNQALNSFEESFFEEKKPINEDINKA